jgi:hypothetical protein
MDFGQFPSLARSPPCAAVCLAEISLSLAIDRATSQLLKFSAAEIVALLWTGKFGC